MRNLLSTHRSVLRDPDSGIPITGSAWDVESDSIIYTLGPTKNDALIRLKRWRPNNDNHEIDCIASWDAPCPLPDLDCDRVLSLQYFPDFSTTCIVLAGGDIIIVRENAQPNEEKIEIMGSVDVGISAAAWSPDEELLAITTRADTLLYMTRDFSNTSDATLTVEDLKSSKHVSVGWGKKETQFKGKGAMALRDPTMPEKVDEGAFSVHDDRSTTISWRGDGAYVAVNSAQASPRRVIRVYSREGVLDGVSEPVDGLEGGLSWRPVGNLLAGIQRLEDRVDVVFFERNGLRHGQFTLRLSKKDMKDWASVISLQWNIDSSVLAVSFKDRIQLWTMGNYHYYLKHETRIPVSEAQSTTLSFVWHLEQPLLYTFTSNGSVHRVEFISQVCAGPTSSPDDYGIVSVIDGKNVKLTALRIANVPPPMALSEIQAESNVTSTAVFGGGVETKIAVLEESSISLYSWDLTARPVQPPILLTIKDLSADPVYNNIQQIVYIDNEHLKLLKFEGPGCSVHNFSFASSEIIYSGTTLMPHLRSIIPKTHTLNCYPYLFLENSGALSADPSAFDLDQYSDGNIRTIVTVLPQRLQEIKVVDVSGDLSRLSGDASTVLKSTTIAFGLTFNGSLFANKRRLAKDCTSFVVTPVHLIYTTTQHLLKFVHLTTVDQLEVPLDTPEVDERCRSVERGAKLVTVMPSISALVLQMPRGNLETIYPRALVLDGIRQSLDEKRYKKAFLACRTHRVDMNILHDHAPETFISEASMFVDQVAKVEHIDLFLSQLREENVVETMYRETKGRLEQATNMTPITKTLPALSNRVRTSKVNTICDTFLEVLRRRASTNLQNIITSHVCKTPPDLEAGLVEVSKLQKDNPEAAEKAVEHICFLADINRLYDNALGLYDLELVLLVAQQSQKDPREYLPFLQNLQEMQVLRRQFTIDNYLGRYTKALKHLQAMNEFEEFQSYVTRHSLYADALHMYRRQEDQYRAIMALYADYLLREAKYRESGIAFEYLRNYASASEAYRLAHLWKESLSCAKLVPLSDKSVQSLARAIAASLLELKDYASAATIYSDYLHDIESAARLFCKGYFFADAIRILSHSNRSDLIDTTVDAGLVEGMATMIELLAECKAQLNAQVPRLRELRIKKAEEPLAFYDGDVNESADIPDDVSLVGTEASTTGGSLFTRYTNRTGTVGTNATRQTSKNKRREERKRARGKKGSVYEEEYLVNSVGRLIERVNTVGEEMGRLVVGLMRRGMRERAKAVEDAMLEVVRSCGECIGEVFAQNDTSENGQEAPEVKNFDKLSIL